MALSNREQDILEWHVRCPRNHWTVPWAVDNSLRWRGWLSTDGLNYAPTTAALLWLYGAAPCR